MSLARALSALLPARRISTRAADLEVAAGDESACGPVRPQAVAWAAVYRGGQPSRLLCFGPCRPDYGPGAGSSLEGNPIPVRGGIVLDLSRMDAIVEVHQEDLQVSVQPGIVYQRLNEQLSPWGMFFPPSPGGSSDVTTIGGMVANNASGIYSVKYGGTREQVKAATVVTGSGQVLDLGTRCRKTSSGYHLPGLVVGSEGTLAIATQLTLSLAGLPQGRKQGALRFSTGKDAATAIATMMRYGLDLAAVEFLDRRSIAALNRYRGFGWRSSRRCFLRSTVRHPRLMRCLQAPRRCV